MARKHSLKCAVGSKRFTVLEVFGFSSRGATADTYAGRSFEAALRAVQPDRGQVVRVFVACARDAGEARLLPRSRRTLIKSFRYKRG